ncbi:GMC family oxidoreductase [Corynebacterium sp. 320]|uniref:GMC oxidoreductase n=1 Tax=Corynebacterium TaxID=1716 RepID=UPI00125CAEF4|nr:MULTISPECIES: GMC family oxidoreductase [Corynebacterium]KAB1502429.1 GMC family oxidoreductase [Corynebacterium sp. 320]KAB1551350.1 GMC family oxidoreductase [Corynebacterium sp. 321]KAB3526036.1 GMC family oxidoreductase [Corynebacterium sp. 250]QNP92767.1 GMC family oxidoreductase [Corynebacterium zhongnanshanii]
MTNTAHSAHNSIHYDVLVIGSGFGGSVTALRLTEKGYKVGVIEAGRRFEDKEFAKNSWHLKDFLWAPQIGCFGIQRVHLLNDVMILAGSGVGGGSLNYANTLYKPSSTYFQDKQWAHITDWEDELTPYYEQAQKMLGVVENPTMTNSDKRIKEVAEEMGVPETFRMAPVGVFFGEKTGLKGKPRETVADPYFGGVGPDRTACHECGECMTGCRHGAKNTLLKNYLYLAEKGGTVVHDMSTVTDITHDGSTWTVTTTRTGTVATSLAKKLSARKKNTSTTTFTADYVVMAAGTWGTQNLLHRQKDNGNLPNLPDSLGYLTRTNSEALLGAAEAKYHPDTDYSEGVAITSSFFPAPDTHIEPVRYGKGSNAMGLLQTLMTDGDKLQPRFLEFIKQVCLNYTRIPMLFNLSKWSQRTVINLVMQTKDNSLQTFLKKVGPFNVLRSRQGTGEPNPSWIPEGNAATRIMARNMKNAIAGGVWSEVFNVPLTAHFLGGCVIADSPETGVVDPYNRVWGYPTMFVTDGSAITANPGVNPSLSITANAERAAALWPNKGDADPRPAQSEGYVRISPTEPKKPMVPASAPAALRLPLTVI